MRIQIFPLHFCFILCQQIFIILFPIIIQLLITVSLQLFLTNRRFFTRYFITNKTVFKTVLFFNLKMFLLLLLGSNKYYIQYLCCCSCTCTYFCLLLLPHQFQTRPSQNSNTSEILKLPTTLLRCEVNQ